MRLEQELSIVQVPEFRMALDTAHFAAYQAVEVALRANSPAFIYLSHAEVIRLQLQELLGLVDGKPYRPFLKRRRGRAIPLDVRAKISATLRGNKNARRDKS